LKHILRDVGIDEEFIKEINYARNKINDRTLFKTDHHEVLKMMKSINDQIMQNI